MDAPGADAKHCRGWTFHAGIGYYALFLDRKAALADYTTEKHRPRSGPVFRLATLPQPCHRRCRAIYVISEVFRVFQTLPQDFLRLTWISWHCGWQTNQR
jgi:hypothetical protein